MPDSILLKEKGLSDDEYAEIKKHTVVGVDILQPVSYFKNILPIIKYHHERYDGTGYPEGLKVKKSLIWRALLLWLIVLMP